MLRVSLGASALVLMLSVSVASAQGPNGSGPGGPGGPGGAGGAVLGGSASTTGSLPSVKTQLRASDEEWKIIEERAARRDLASDEEVEAVFSRYRRA